MEGILWQEYNGSSEISDRAWHLEQRTIFINGEIRDETAYRFISEILYLAREKEKTVRVFLNSPGGEVDAGMVIVDLLLSSKMDIDIYVAGIAASMAAIIACCGKKGKRFILPSSKIMLHEPSLVSGNQNASSLENISKKLNATRDRLNQLIAEHSGKGIEEIQRIMTGTDHWMNAEEAVAFGLVDAIKTPDI